MDFVERDGQFFSDFLLSAVMRENILFYLAIQNVILAGIAVFFFISLRKNPPAFFAPLAFPFLPETVSLPYSTCQYNPSIAKKSQCLILIG